MKKFIFILTIAVVISVIALAISKRNAPGVYDEFAKCLGEKGATFYGAFWCPHCQAQKKLFGNSERLLPYVECSTPNGKGQYQVCIDNGVQSYPTWIFADKSVLTGEQTLADLAEKTACKLP